MTDHELKKLLNTPTPAPRGAAREAAHGAALAEFDASMSDAAANQTHDRHAHRRESNYRAKGSGRRARLSSNRTLLERKITMRSLTKYAVAASVVAVAIVGPASIYMSRLADREQPVTGGPGGVQGLQTFSGSRPNIVREETLAGAPQKIAANKPTVLPSPQSSTTEKKQHREVQTANVKPDERSADTGYRGRQGRDSAQLKDQIVAKTEKITPPATGRLKQMGEFYTHNGPNRGPTDGLGAVGGSGWTRSMGGGTPPPRAQVRPPSGRRIMSGAADNAAINLKGAKYGIASRSVRSQELVAAGRLLNFGDDSRQLARQSRDKFLGKTSNTMKQVATNPVSTFSLDVDTASYAFVRRALNAGRLPPKDAVRVEELINYFNYNYAPPVSREEPFKIDVNVVPPPWNAVNRLVHLSIKGYELAQDERPPANLVFLVDVSGSMSSHDKLPLVKTALRMLVNELRPEDTLGIVTYASGTAVALEPTKVSEKHKILSVIGNLRAGGSTAGARGIQDAYRLAEGNYNPEGVNRIILATDGDFNVGITNREELKRYIERKRESGVFLSILGFGRGNYNDALMQTLAQNGNGTASYIDTLNEARKVLVDEASSTLFTIAKDVKVQVEFNPERVRSYRLIGYETRALKREDFNNDRVDAGDVGSGHSVTAIYEITPAGAPPAVDDLRYGRARTEPAASVDPNAELGFVKLRYKLPDATTSKLISQAITPREEKASLDQVSDDTRFSIAVAGFGQLLRDNPAVRDFGYGDVIDLAARARGEDRFGYRTEFINLARNARSAAR